MKNSLGKRFRFNLLVSLSTLGLWSVFAFAFEVYVAHAPVNTLELTLKAINSAKKTIQMNAYELSSPEISDALIRKIKAGVHVEILQEGSPVGGLSRPAKEVQANIVAAMKASRIQDHLYLMSSKAGAKRRFRFDHAKYIVIDQQSLLIGSENYSPTGNPESGNIGNRGWEVLIEDPAQAQEFSSLFQKDTNMRNGDMFELVEEDSSDLLNISNLFNNFVEVSDLSGGSLTSLRLDAAIKKLTATSAETILSPKSQQGLVDLMDQAEESLDIQMMTFDENWGRTGEESPLFQAALAAAQRNVTTRILLNDDRVFTHSSESKNQEVADSFNREAKKRRLPLEAIVADIKGMGVSYIHNKGALVDGKKTLVSSINWGQNSVMNNREAAKLITSPAINQYYKALFESDWNISKKRR